MGPNFSMIFLLFLICYKEAHRVKLDSAPKYLPVSFLESLCVSIEINIQIAREFFSLATLLLIVDLPNTRYYSVDR